MTPAPDHAQRWLSRTEAAAYLRLSPRTFARQVKAGRLPAPARASTRRPVWCRHALDRALTGGDDADNLDPIMAAIDAATAQAAEVR